MSLGILKDIMLFDDHRDSTEPNAISITTLLGPAYKAKHYLNKSGKYENDDITFKRSSFIGTAFHARADMITRDREDYKTEEFLERKVTVDGIEYTISGSYDGLKLVEGKWYIFDYKTGYGKTRNEVALQKDAMQMSLYRWLLEEKYPDITIEDEGYTIFVSQSNNVMEEIEVQLTDIHSVEDFIDAKIYMIVHNEKVDCHEGIKYNGCTYCPWNCPERKH